MDAFSTEFWRNGPRPGEIYNFPGGGITQHKEPTKRTLGMGSPSVQKLFRTIFIWTKDIRNFQESDMATENQPSEKESDVVLSCCFLSEVDILHVYPSVTGTSVLGLRFNGGVVIAADKLGSYGSMARFRDLSRILKVNDQVVVGASGDYADYQFLSDIIEQRVIEEECLDDGFNYTPTSLFSWLTRVMYNRRCKINPLWNTYVVAGLQDGEPFLGYVDKIGVAYQAPTVSTGYGAYIAQPLMREACEKNPNMSAKEATEVIDRCMKVLYYRDARSLNKYEVAIVTKDGVEIKSPVVSKPNWEVATLIKGYE